MNRIFILIVTSLALCVTACASSRAMTPTATPTVAAAAKQPPSGCVANPATRISASPRDCAGSGRVWTDEDLKSTGASDAAHALRQLDPTVTIAH